MRGIGADDDDAGSRRGTSHHHALSRPTGINISRRRYEEAVRIQEQILATTIKRRGEGAPDTIAPMKNLALSYLRAGNPKDAMELSRKVAKESGLDLSHPSMLSWFGQFVIAQGVEHDEAEKGSKYWPQ